ncbi:MAG: hypothetical protein JWQ19_2006 [Subtercola sp.]|nr:hypothetical protein [Subtercola sp.]
MTRRGSGPVALSGIARSHRTGFTRGASALSIAAVAVLLSGCATSDDGVVLKGADGNNYVVPDGAERPQYATREDCIADVTEQIAKLQAEGESIGDDPNTLCEESSRYPSAHYAYPFLGPIIFAGSRWNSPRVSGWSGLTSGGFGAAGSSIQPDVVQPAPAGAKAGDRAALKGGFGTSGKSGFGESVGG